MRSRNEFVEIKRGKRVKQAEMGRCLKQEVNEMRYLGILIVVLGLMLMGTTDVMAQATGDISVTCTMDSVLSAYVYVTSVGSGSAAVWDVDGGSNDLALGATVNTIGIGPDYFTVYNDGTESASIDISIGASATWAVGAAAGTETFAMDVSINQGAGWTNMNSSVTNFFVANVAGGGGTNAFDLQFHAPDETAATIEQQITVTITAQVAI